MNQPLLIISHIHYKKSNKLFVDPLEKVYQIYEPKNPMPSY